mmetsp:Transcript_72059/g.208709  ORF Transcript_72059/g.208709 Transcript_72059/m.208709 type:complete len:305 (-) Transcript_72059:172-1086(-)
MSSSTLPQEVLLALCGFMDRDQLVQFCPTCQCTCSASKQLAANLIDRDFQGMFLVSGELRPGASALSYLLKLEHALHDGVVLARGFRNDWPRQTKPAGISLDTAGPWFVEFEVVAARAPNGMPTLGVTDAVLQDGSTWSQDLSRPSAEGLVHDGFALSFCPASGRVFAAVPPNASERLRGGEIMDEEDYLAKAAGKRRTFAGCLPWPELGDPCSRRNQPISAGIYVHQGQLTLYRIGGGDWHSSGVVVDNLQSRISPCMFMFSFLGYTHVRFVGLRRTPPAVCLHCDATGHGFPSGWWLWPSQQ